MTTSPSEPVENDQSIYADEGQGQEASRQGEAGRPDLDDQDSEPTSTAPAENNPTVPDPDVQ